MSYFGIFEKKIQKTIVTVEFVKMQNFIQKRKMIKFAIFEIVTCQNKIFEQNL